MRANLICERLKQHKSREEIAEAIGVTPACVRHWENGIRSPLVDQAAKLAEILGEEDKMLWLMEDDGRGKVPGHFG